jgi:hypothetical protein
MIAPQPGHPGIIGQQHGLQRLTETLAALEAGQRQQATRDTQIQTHLTTQATLLTQAMRWSRYQRTAIAGLGRLTLVLGGLLGWQRLRTPEQGYARALRSFTGGGWSGWAACSAP